MDKKLYLKFFEIFIINNFIFILFGDKSLSWLEKLEKNKKYQVAMACAFACIVVTGFYVDDAVYDNVLESGLVGMIIGALLAVVVAAALLPTIAENTVGLENNNSDLDSTEQTVIGLWPLFVVLGVALGLIGFAI